jgi:hypothetical protein
MPSRRWNFSANPTQALMQPTGSVPGQGAKTYEIDESQFLHVHMHGSYRNFFFCCSVRSALLVSSRSARMFTRSLHKCSAVGVEVHRKRSGLWQIVFISYATT